MTSSNGNIFRVTGPLCREFALTGEFPSQRPVDRSFDVFFDLRLNKHLCKQPRRRQFQTPSRSLWRQCNDLLKGCSMKGLRHWSNFTANSQATILHKENYLQGLSFCMANLLYAQGLMSELYFEGIASEIEKYDFFNRVSYHNKFFNKRIWIIKCFQTHYLLLKFTIRDMPFKTKLTSLVDTRALTDNALSKIVRITAVIRGAKCKPDFYPFCPFSFHLTELSAS